MNLSKIEGEPSSKWFIYQGYKGAGEKINSSIEARNLSAVHSTFADLQQKLQAVETKDLKKHMKMLWREYSMLLMNDAVEGKVAKDLDVAEHVALGGLRDRPSKVGADAEVGQCRFLDGVAVHNGCCETLRNISQDWTLHDPSGTTIRR